MPAGVYDRFDGSGHPIGTEDFRTAPGVAGSRWFSTLRLAGPENTEEIIDISTDADWLPVRLRIGTPKHHLILQRNVNDFAGALDDERLAIGEVRDFHYRSPVFNALTANRLRLA